MSRRKAVENQPELIFDSSEPHELLNVWYIIRETDEKLCILYVYEWDYSTFCYPFNHAGDYEPIIYCLDKNTRETTWVYDNGHYDAGTTSDTNVFQVVSGSHRYIPDDSGISGTKQPSSNFQELDAATLMEWERTLIDLHRLGMGQLSLWQAFLDPCSVEDNDEFGLPDDGTIEQEADGYSLTATWEYSYSGLNHYWFEYDLHNKSTEILTSLKLCFDKEPSVDDVTILDPETKRWGWRVSGKCLIIELEEGFASRYGIRRCSSLVFQVVSNAWPDLGTADVAVNRGNSHTYRDDEENITIPGPVSYVAPDTPFGDHPTAIASASFEQLFGRRGAQYFKGITDASARFDGSLLLDANARSKFKTYGEIAEAPLSAIKGIGRKQNAMLSDLFGIKTVGELAKLDAHPLPRMARAIRKLASLEKSIKRPPLVAEKDSKPSIKSKRKPVKKR